MTKRTPINPPDVVGAGRRELPAYVSNGLIGLRVRDVPLTTGMTLLSGYSGEHYERQIEAAAVAPYPLAPAEEKATLELYLGMARDYIGSPMLSALYGAWAARLGDRSLSLKLLDEGYGQFCTGRFLQTLEYRADRFPEQSQAGPFFANIGGFLTGLLFGFTGLKVGPGGPETWIEREVVLPQGWTAIEVDRLWVRGRATRLSARQGEMARLEPL
ncbi:hypothetical protein BH10PSE4_BH10PSE4_32090 [soil metagenome]